MGSNSNLVTKELDLKLNRIKEGGSDSNPRELQGSSPFLNLERH